jgi:voltage-gated potassium channel
LESNFQNLRHRPELEKEKSLFQRVKFIIEDHDTPAGRNFDLFIQIFIFISLITFSIETLETVYEEWGWLLNLIEIITVCVFTLEYILRIVVADNKLRFIFSFYGLIDLLAILPFYLTIGVDLRTIRVLRFMRLFRLIKLGRYNAATKRFALALRIAKEEIIMFIFVSSTMMYISAVGIYYFEHEAQPEAFSSVFHSLWWSVITLTTVGYGDIYPITLGGRIFTFFMLLVGVGIISVPAGLIAAALNEARRIEEEQKAHKRTRSS